MTPPSQLCLCVNTLASPTSMNEPVPSLHAYKQTSTYEPLNPIVSSSVDHGLTHQSSSYPNCPLHHDTAMNSTAYRLNPDGRYGASHDSQSVDHLSSSRAFASGAVHSSGAYQKYLARSSQMHKDGVSEPPVWSNPAGRMDTPLSYSAYPFPAASRSNGQTSIPNDPFPTAGFSPHSSSQNSITHNRPELPPFGYYQSPPQPTTVFGMCSTHLVTFHPFCHPLGGWPHLACPSGVPAMHSFTNHPQRPHLPPTPYLSHSAFYSPVPHPSMLYPYTGPQRGWIKKGGRKRGGKKRSGMKKGAKKSRAPVVVNEEGEGGEGKNKEKKNDEENDNGGVNGKW